MRTTQPSTFTDTFRFPFGHLFETLDSTPQQSRGPLDVSEGTDRYCVEMDLPGFTIEGLDITVMGRALHVRGRREMPKHEDRTWHRRDARRVEVDEILRFPVELDVDKVEASFANGVLTIELPQAGAALPKKIQVKTK